MDTPVPLLPDEDVIDSQNWQETVEPHVLASLTSREIDRQAVIYGTRSHMNTKNSFNACPKADHLETCLKTVILQFLLLLFVVQK